MVDRRDFLKAAGGAIVAASLPGCQQGDRWKPTAFVKQPRSRVADLLAVVVPEVAAEGVSLLEVGVLPRVVVHQPSAGGVDCDRI
ncbi:MAG: twin-arginine translocation signal domain-containing protein, partial [Gemmatimonadota bacterium]